MQKFDQNTRATLKIFGLIAVLLSALVLFQYNNYDKNKKRLEDQLFRQQDYITSLGAERILDYFRDISAGLDKLAFSVSHHDGPHASEDMGRIFESFDGKVDSMAYFDSSGEKKFSVMGKGAMGELPESARFEEFFLVSRNSKVPYVSPLNHEGGTEGVTISWPVADSNGGFEGVVAARINRLTFSRLCQSLDHMDKNGGFVNFVYFDQLGQCLCVPGYCPGAGLFNNHPLKKSPGPEIVTGWLGDNPGKRKRFRVVQVPLQVEGYKWRLASEMPLSGIDGLMRGDLTFLLVAGGFVVIALMAGGFYFKRVYGAKARAESEAAYSATLAAKNDSLEAEKSKLIAVLNTIPDGIMLIGRDGKVVNANSRMREVAASAVGAAVGGKEFPLENLAGPVSGDAEASIAGRTYKIISVPVNGDPAGSATEVREVRLVRDVTVEKMLEQKRSDIAHMITHDVRNPLSVIIGIAQWLEDDRAGFDLTDELKSGIETISRASSRVLTLMENFLFLTSLDGPGKLAKKPVNLNPFLKRAILEYKLEARKKNIELSLSVPDNLPVVSMDDVQIMRAASNLIGNALKYTPAGGKVSVFAKNFRDYVTISVSDNGAGISKNDLPHIFNRYYRSKRTGKGKTGSGLGLAIVKAVVESHGGTVDVVSEEEMGATFTLRLPVSCAMEEAPAAIN